MTTNKIKYILTPLLAAAALLSGCSGDGDGCPSGGPAGTAGQDGGAAILFSGAAEGTGSTTRAAADFPNTTIGVTATYTDSVDDWTAFEDINNTPASVTAESGGVFTFKWDTAAAKYWPFDGAQLYFAAYSPHTSESDAITLYNDLTHLGIEIGPDTPDVMYATGNARQAWSKADGTVDLGTFNHALSQLTVVVTADGTTFNPDITIGSLAVRTSRPYGVIDLLGDTDDNLAFVVAPDYTYNLVTSSTSFSLADPYTTTVYLFPETEEQTEIIITLEDSTFSYTGTYTLSDIPYDDDKESTLTLARAANTTVTLVIKSTSIQNPDRDIALQGVLSEWIDMGDLEVTIN